MTMFPGMRGMNPRQMEAMMRKMGIKTQNIKATKVVIYMDDEKIVIKEPSVTAMIVQGDKTYQISGKETKARRKRKGSAGNEEEGLETETEPEPDLEPEPEPEPETEPEEGPSGPKYAEEDVKLVMEQTGCSEEKARRALEESDGQPAEAILRLMS